MGHDVDRFDVDAQRGCSPADFTSADAALICTPASTHEYMAQLLLAIGYRGPLFVEKPLTLPEYPKASVFRTWPHPVTMVGYNWRFHPEVAPLAVIARRGSTV